MTAHPCMCDVMLLIKLSLTFVSIQVILVNVSQTENSANCDSWAFLFGWLVGWIFGFCFFRWLAKLAVCDSFFWQVWHKIFFGGLSMRIWKFFQRLDLSNIFAFAFLQVWLLRSDLLLLNSVHKMMHNTTRPQVLSFFFFQKIKQLIIMLNK